MEYLIGAVLGAGTCAFALLTGFDRERVFYPTMLISIATYYIGFAVMGRSVQAVTTESLLAGLFLVVAVVGFKKNLWFVVAALAGHGVFDTFITCLLRIRVSRCGGQVSAWDSISSPAGS